MGVDRKDKRFFDFMCSCKDEGRKRCDDVYEEVKVALGRETEPVSDKKFLTYLVYALNDMNNGSANIEHIYTDMWSGLAVKYQYDYNECECEDDCECEEWKVQDFWIECDKLHHGLARAYQLVEQFDKSVAENKALK